MARRKVLPEPGEEEVSMESEDIEESEEETEGEEKAHEEKMLAKKQTTLSLTTPPCEEEGEADEGEESDSPPSSHAKAVRVEKQTLKDTKPISKHSLKVRKDSKNKKKAKTSKGEKQKVKDLAASASASGVGGRLLGEEDEIALLQGIIDYQNNGADLSNMVAFHDFIKEKLHAEISRTQLYEKVRRFKKKFLSNVCKGEGGKDPNFSKPHESKTFALSKMIWGSGVVVENKEKDVARIGGNSGTGKENVATIGGNSGTIKENVASIGNKSGIVKDDVALDDEAHFRLKYPHLSASLDDLSFLPDGARSFFKEHLRMIDGRKASELEEKWKKLRERETKLFAKRMLLTRAQIELVLVGKSGSY